MRHAASTICFGSFFPYMAMSAAWEMTNIGFIGHYSSQWIGNTSALGNSPKIRGEKHKCILCVAFLVYCCWLDRTALFGVILGPGWWDTCHVTCQQTEAALHAKGEKVKMSLHMVAAGMK